MWIDINKEKPKDKQPVFYYFKYTGVGVGHYWLQEVDERVFGESGIFMDCFFGLKGGWLCDDVTHWQPREESNTTAPLPPDIT